MSLHLSHSYHLNENKRIDEIAQLIEDYYKKRGGLNVSCDELNSTTYSIYCKTNKKSLRGIMGFLGVRNDYDAFVLLCQNGDSLTVEYWRDGSDSSRGFNALFKAFFLFGIIQLDDIKSQHGIPQELHTIISKYLRQ